MIDVAAADPPPALWEGAPPDWPDVPQEVIQDHAARTRAATDAALEPGGLAALFSAVTGAAGHPGVLAARWREYPTPGPADLYLLGLLGHEVGLPIAERLSVGPEASALARGAQQLPCDLDLYLADAGVLAGMETLLLATDAAMSGSGLDACSRRAAAHFLCARRRPRLFPSAVPAVGHADPLGHRTHWQLARAVASDVHLRQQLAVLSHHHGVPRDISEPDLLDLCLAASRQHGR